MIIEVIFFPVIEILWLTEFEVLLVMGIEPKQLVYYMCILFQLQESPLIKDGFMKYRVFRLLWHRL